MIYLLFPWTAPGRFSAGRYHFRDLFALDPSLEDDTTKKRKGGVFVQEMPLSYNPIQKQKTCFAIGRRPIAAGDCIQVVGVLHGFPSETASGRS